MEKNKVFFIGDMHFGHENAIKFDNRPFSSVEEMDEELVRRWNNKVSSGDLVYVLGDMIWKTKNGKATDIIKSLNGQKILIRGNHDRFLHDASVRKAFAAIKDYDDINIELADRTKRRCILSHYFIPFYNAHRYNAVHLHAHSHISDESKIEIGFAKWLNENGYKNEIYNVGCMHWNYEPVTLDEILAGSDKK